MTPLECALESVDDFCAKNKHPESNVIRHRTRAMLRAYATVWSGDSDKYEVIGVETLRLAPLKNLENGKDSGYLAGGKIDLVVKEKSDRRRILIIDHKNLSHSLDQDRIEHLLIDGQPLQYGYLEYANGVKVDAFMYDVLCKTAHEPYKAGKTRKVAETLEEFEERLLSVYLEDHKKYFARPSVPMLKQGIAENIHELYLWTKELDIDCRGKIHLRNPGACFEFQRPCKYLGLCSGRSFEDDGSWIKHPPSHKELELPASVDPSKVITNSRMKLFRTCRLKHYRQYVQGLEKVNEKPEEALFLGTASHLGLEQYWKAIASGINH